MGIELSLTDALVYPAVLLVFKSPPHGGIRKPPAHLLGLNSARAEVLLLLQDLHKVGLSL